MLLSGGLALVPTETVYGIGVAVRAFAEPAEPVESVESAGVASAATGPGAASAAVVGPTVAAASPAVVALPPEGSGYRRIFSLKQRDLVQTVPWLVAGEDDLDIYGQDAGEQTHALARAFWPGALTLIVKASDAVPAFMRAADGTVALRASASPVVQGLIRACGSPLAVTSANTHGAPAPASFAEVEPRVLAGVDVAIDAGATACRTASTIVSCIHGRAEVLREGALSAAQIEDALGSEPARM